MAMTEKQLLKFTDNLPPVEGFDKQYNDCLVEVHHFPHGNTVAISTEYGDGAGNYYGPQGYPVINPILEAYAKKNGGYWEWVNAACFAFYK